MIERMAAACAAIYFEKKNPSLGEINVYKKAFIAAYKGKK
jgi:hypothetical protein